MKAYTPGSGLGSETNADAISAPPSCAITMRVWTITASVTGFSLGLCTSRTATVATTINPLISHMNIRPALIALNLPEAVTAFVTPERPGVTDC